MNSSLQHKMPLEFVKRVKEAITERKSLEGELKQVTEDGKECWFQNSVMPILDDDWSGNLISYIEFK